MIKELMSRSLPGDHQGGAAGFNGFHETLSPMAHGSCCARGMSAPRLPVVTGAFASEIGNTLYGETSTGTTSAPVRRKMKCRTQLLGASFPSTCAGLNLQCCAASRAIREKY